MRAFEWTIYILGVLSYPLMVYRQWQSNTGT